MPGVLLDQPVSSIDEGHICFGNERTYADYIVKQDSPPSEIKAYYVENGVKILYSDCQPLPTLLTELKEVHKQIETGASMTEYGELRERLGL